MAGIGYELRRLLRKDTLVGALEAYGYAGVIGSGPWVLSILGILAIGILSAPVVGAAVEVTQFQVSVTYLIATSLIFAGLIQLAFTRYVSDRLFEKKDEVVLPAYNGVLLLTMAASGALGMVLLFVLFPGFSIAYRILMLACFVLLSGIWVTTIFLSGLKLYKSIVVLFAAGYTVTVTVALLLRGYGLEGLLLGFLVGHFIIFVGMWLLTAYRYAPPRAIAFDFLRRDLAYPSLMVVGLLYNTAVWADKFMFWFFPPTSDAIIGPLRASLIYDLPVFLAYLSIIPGMAVFLVRVETDFVDYYERFYDGVRGGSSLRFIEDMRDEMVQSVRNGLGEIAKIQTLAVLATFAAGPALLDVLGISELYLPLFYVQTVGASLQVLVLALLNILLYLDQRKIILLLCVTFLVLNVALTALSLWLGAAFYGYGYCLAVLLTLGLGLYLLDWKLGRLEYETFMLQ